MPSTNTIKKSKIEDQRVSVCSDCKAGIFKHHTYLWTRRGLVHEGCNDKKVDKTEELNETKSVT